MLLGSSPSGHCAVLRRRLHLTHNWGRSTDSLRAKSRLRNSASTWDALGAPARGYRKFDANNKKEQCANSTNFNQHQAVPLTKFSPSKRRAGPGTGCGANISSFSFSCGKARPRCSQVTVFPKMRRFYWFSRRVIALWRASKLLRTKEAARLAQDGLGTDASVWG